MCSFVFFRHFALYQKSRKNNRNVLQPFLNNYSEFDFTIMLNYLLYCSAYIIDKIENILYSKEILFSENCYKDIFW